MAVTFTDLLSERDPGSTLLARNIAALGTEIERLKRHEPSLNLSELLPALLGSVRDGGVVVYSREGQIVSLWLPLELKLRFGLDVPAMLGTGLNDFLPPGAYAERIELIQHAIELGETMRHEFFIDFPSGRFWIEATISPLYSSSGEVRHLVSFFRDISRRKQAERSRDESEARYRGIVENSLDAIMLTRPDGIIEYLSPSTLKVLGWLPEELIGTRPNITHPADAARTKQNMREALAGGSGSGYEYRILTRDDQVRWISHSWSPIMDDGKVAMVVSIVRDITERKRMEQELRQVERLAAMGQTIADIAHQLKTICLNIRGSASLFDKALDHGRTESMRALWGVFQRSSDRLATLAIEMLEYAGLDALSSKPFSLNTMLREIHQECAGKAAPRNIMLRLKLDERIQAVTADPGKVAEVCMNLICNAIDACQDRSGGMVEIQTELDAPHRQVRISVIDNGSGIPEEIMPRIFDPFFTTKGSKGTGLGLAIVQKSVQLHGGRIEVESKPGRTNLTVILPLSS